MIPFIFTGDVYAEVNKPKKSIKPPKAGDSVSDDRALYASVQDDEGLYGDVRDEEPSASGGQQPEKVGSNDLN
jgi:hypothetical protein